MAPKGTSAAELKKRLDEFDGTLADALSRINTLEKKLDKISKAGSNTKKEKKEKKEKADADDKKEKAGVNVKQEQVSVTDKNDRRKDQRIQAAERKRKAADETTSAISSNMIVVDSKKARNGQTPASKEDTVATAPPEPNMQQVVVKDPGEEHRCYDVLGIHPSASLEDVKRAFKRRALKAHPDKEGGSQAAFMCLNKSYELLCDASKRSVYDFELQQLRSQDGQSFSAVKHPQDEQTASEEHGNPEMLSEAFMNLSENSWLDLLQILTSPNLCGLIRHLQSKLAGNTQVQSHKASDETKSNSKQQGVPGLKSIKQTGKYQGQVVWQNNRVVSFATALEEALDARMCLETLRQTVLKRTADGSTFDAAFRDAVAQLREKEQNSCFFLTFAFECQLKDARGKNANRITTPLTSDEDTFLEHRNILINLRDNGATIEASKKAHGNMLAEVKQVKIRRAASKTNSIIKLLEDAKAELKARGKELPAQASVAARVAKASLPAITVKQFKVIGPRKVGILPRPDPSLTATGYMEPRAMFDVSMVHISNGVKFFQLSDGSGWLPQCSRKEPSRIVVEQADAEFDRAAILDAEEEEDSANSDKDSKSSNSSSSSSS